MSAPPTLEDAIVAHPSCTRVQGVLFSRIEHTASGAGVHIGFRCFACDESALLTAFLSGDIDAVAALPPALDASGAPAISLVRLDIATLEGADALVGLQPVRYVDYRPVPAAPALILEGAAAAEWARTLRDLDQQGG